MMNTCPEIRFCPQCGSEDIDLLYIINVTTVIRCNKCNKKQSIKEKEDDKKE